MKSGLPLDMNCFNLLLLFHFKCCCADEISGQEASDISLLAKRPAISRMTTIISTRSWDEIGQFPPFPSFDHVPCVEDITRHPSTAPLAAQGVGTGAAHHPGQRIRVEL